jgi:hypothetical protein
MFNPLLQELPLLTRGQTIYLEFQVQGEWHLKYVYNEPTKGFQTHLLPATNCEALSHHQEVVPGGIEPKASSLPAAMKMVRDFHDSYCQDLWRLRYPFIWAEFESLQSYDAIVGSEWRCVEQMYQELPASRLASELILSHNNLESGVWYSNNNAQLINVEMAACNPRAFDVATLMNVSESCSAEIMLEAYSLGASSDYAFRKHVDVFRLLSALLYAARYYQQGQRKKGNEFLELYFKLKNSLKIE